MNKLIMLKSLPHLLLALMFTFQVSAQGNDILAGLNNPQEQFYTGGAVTKEELQALKASGVTHIVNLRAKDESDWDEGEAVQSLGMQYHHIPIHGKVDVTAENAAKLDAVLKELAGQSVYVHCASGNRVGALVALTASESMNAQEAIAEGKRWGLTRLTPLVQEKIKQP